MTRSFQDAKEQLKRRNVTLVSDLIKDIRKVVEELGRDEGYTVILEKNAQGVMYTDDALDITDKVVERYNAKDSKK